MTATLVNRWAEGRGGRNLATLLQSFGGLAVGVSVIITSMAFHAGKFLQLPRYLLVIPIWGAAAIGLALLLRRDMNRPMVFVIGIVWLALGFLPAFWAEFLA